MDHEVFVTEDVKLATYLVLIGYDVPTFRLCENSNSKVKFEFNISINQASILSFYSREPISISPLLVLDIHQKLVAGAKLAIFHLSADVFQS